MEFHLAEVEAMPLPGAVADVCLLYNALHCFPDSEAALDEVVRCVKPGATVLGSMLVRGAVARADRLLEANAAAAVMGPGGTKEDLQRWLGGRLVGAEITALGALAVFGGRVPANRAAALG